MISPINNYRTWNRSTGNASNDGSPYIAPMQGFLMLATGLEPSVLAPRSARASEAQRLLKETAVNADMVRLELQLTRGERQENMQVLIHADDRTVDVRDMTRQLEPLNSERFMIYGVDTKNGAMPAGNHQVILNGANLSSGVYVYRIQAGGVVISRKLTLLK
jgi:hypothetical protein